MRTQSPTSDTIDLVAQLMTQRFGVEGVNRSEIVRRQHGNTQTWIESQPADLVVFAKSREDIIDCVKICADFDVPIVAYGTGTSLEGHLNATYGGVCLDCSGMDQVISLHPEDLCVTVQPGITREALNAYLRDTGLFFPIDPGANASIGGMTSTRASGTNAVRYGTMRENVISIEVVLADGRVIKTGKNVRKSAAGYDMTALFTGSEGTLGILSEITLRLYGIPEAVSGGFCAFPDIRSACDAVIMTIQSGIPVARIELLDAQVAKAENRMFDLGLPEQPLLFLEFHGTEASVREQAERFGEIAAEFDANEFVWTTQAEERNRLWKARHQAYPAIIGLRPGCLSLSTDSCVPISRLSECIEETLVDIRENDLMAPIVGHVGDGNFHVIPLVDPDDEDEKQRVRDFLVRLSDRAIAMGGTCAGEHGIGQGKMKALRKERGELVDVMRLIKDSLDPNDIMNPGKIVYG